jgi:hypothetical protein
MRLMFMKNGLKKKDWILIAVILCVAGLTVLVHTFIGGAGANRVIVKIEGAIEGIYSLSEDREVEINGGTNLLKIKNGEASMSWADCPDQLCVHQKPVSLNRESIICLPNKVVVEVESSGNREFDAVTN